MIKNKLINHYLDKSFECYSSFSNKEAIEYVYENDRVADEAAEKFNVTWSRISPVCVSLCNDYNSLYITGESDHIMGWKAIGNRSSVWKFKFATSFSFSLVEQLVGNNVWNTTVIGSVTLGLLESYLNNKTLEIFTSNGYTFIKREGDNSTLLFLEDETGIVRDYFSYYGLLGTMPCYHDNITENAWKYGDTILNKLSNEYKDLKNIFSISILSSVFVEGGAIALEGISGLSLGVAALVAIPLFIILFPDETNELWKEFIYLLNPNYKDYPNITIYEGIDYNTQKLFDKNPTILVLNGQSLEDYVKFTLNDYFKNPDILSDKTRRKVESKRIKINQPNLDGPGSGPNSNGTENRWKDIGKYLKDLHDEYEIAKNNKMILQFIKSHFWELITVSLTFETINTVDFLIKISLLELSKENSGK